MQLIDDDCWIILIISPSNYVGQYSMLAAHNRIGKGRKAKKKLFMGLRILLPKFLHFRKKIKFYFSLFLFPPM